MLNTSHLSERAGAFHTRFKKVRNVVAGDGPTAPFGARILAKNSPIRGLLANTDQVGAVYRLDGFSEALVITNDAFLRDAHGVPLHAFLLASVPALADPQTAGATGADDEEVVLLRVTGTVPLPDEGDVLRLRARAGFDLVTEDGREIPRTREELIDPLTEVEMQTSGIRCAILGTFYDSQSGRLVFGSDVDNIYASSRLRVYKPYAESLEVIVSYLQEVVGDAKRGIFHLGDVRYASTTRRQNLSKAAGKPTDVAVHVDIADFVSHKTAVLGMTRLGKSNTMKTIATAVFRYGKENDTKIGQLIFDPAAEYAEENVQDQTALAQLGPKHVTRYRFGATEAELVADVGLRPLALNFFDDEEIGAAWDLISDYAVRTNDSNYIRAFANADVVGPLVIEEDDDRREQTYARRARAMLYATLIKAGLEPAATARFRLPTNKSLRDALARTSGPRGDSLSFISSIPSGNDGSIFVSGRQLLLICETIATNAVSDAPDSAFENWYRVPDERIAHIATVLMASSGSGYRVLMGLNEGYHSAAASEDYAPQIYRDLVEGKIVIVDLSRGSEGVLQFASERIVNHMLRRAADKFRSGQEMDVIQVFLEEAHRLFDRDRFKDARATADPYVRLAREAAKYKIGMIYSTQQVSSVEPDVLDNTANWVIAHLNSESEVRLLRGRYEFDRFAEQILRAEDRGFVRLKTLSSRYVVPVQVRKFDKAMIEEAVAVANATDQT